MKKLVLLVAILAVLAVAAISAMAQVEEEFEREIDDTGNVELLVEVSGAGDNSDQCVMLVQGANTDNVQGFIQYASTAGGVEFEDSSLVFGPALKAECEQTQEVAGRIFGADC